MFRSARRKAYTLIEVLVVVTVLGIAASLVIPSMGSANALRVQAAVRSVIADVTFAQSDALAFQQGRAIIFDLDNNRYQVVQVRGSNIDPATDLIYETRITGSTFGDSRLESASLAGSNGRTLIFDEMGAPVTAPGGTTPASNGTIRIVGSGQAFILTIEGYTGRVSVARDTGGGGGGGSEGAGEEGAGE